ncbi:hypothetical protein TNCV_170561 [Trichonephila clavipes]|nr:hypothetical protein TNCV_170561 [Trichonephila clavipes]
MEDYAHSLMAWQVGKFLETGDIKNQSLFLQSSGGPYKQWRLLGRDVKKLISFSQNNEDFLKDLCLKPCVPCVENPIQFQSSSERCLQNK